jgi:ribosomal-protein-alanine N-acetyltransferase
MMVENKGDGGASVLETERLVIRRARADDAGMYYALWTDPQVMTNVGFPRGLPITRQEVLDKIANMESGDEFGVLLVVTLRESGQAIGECKMYRPDEEGISRTDVKLLPRFWGNKYGVEIKRALVDHLFTHTDCDAVEGTPNVENIASIKMQEAVGGVQVGQSVYEFPDHMRDYTRTVRSYIYLVFRDAWAG